MIALVTSLGIAQIISWGTLYYAIGVLGAPMARELGVSEVFVFGAFTAGLLLTGTMSPRIGRLVDARGGRFVLSWGSVVAVVAMAMLAAAPNVPAMVAGWLLAGAAMAACLYDPAFATLARLSGPHYRRAVTALTLFGGFASTAFWPLSHLILERWGWREAFAAYAALHLLVCLPIHLRLPREATRSREAASAEPERSPAFGDPRLGWLTGSLAVGSFVLGVVAVHLVNLLKDAGLTAAEAVAVGMLLGPMQVAGRLVEMALSSRVRAVTMGLATFGLVIAALVALMLVDGFGIAAILFVSAFGWANGIFTVARGTAPVEIFGHRGVGGLLGHLSRAGLYARALAPASFTGMLASGLGRHGALACLAGLAVAGACGYLAATRARR